MITIEWIGPLCSSSKWQSSLDPIPKSFAVWQWWSLGALASLLSPAFVFDLPPLPLSSAPALQVWSGDLAGTIAMWNVQKLKKENEIHLTETGVYSLCQVPTQDTTSCLSLSLLSAPSLLSVERASFLHRRWGRTFG